MDYCLKVLPHLHSRYLEVSQVLHFRMLQLYLQPIHMFFVTEEVLHQEEIELEERKTLPSEPPRCFPFIKTCGTVRLPTILLKAS